MRILRAFCGSTGILMLGWGGLLLLRTGHVVRDVPWLLAPVLVHDLLLAPLVVALVWLGMRVLPETAHTAAMVGLVVTGGLTLVALSVVGRVGADPHNPSLLDRNYLAGWLVAVATVWVTVAIVAVVQRHRASAQPVSTRDSS